MRQCEVPHYPAGYCFTMNHGETLCNAWLSAATEHKEYLQIACLEKFCSGTSMRGIKEGKCVYPVPSLLLFLLSPNSSHSKLIPHTSALRYVALLVSSWNVDLITSYTAFHLSPEEVRQPETQGVWLLRPTYSRNPKEGLMFPEQVTGRLLVWEVGSQWGLCPVPGLCQKPS